MENTLKLPNPIVYVGTVEGLKQFLREMLEVEKKIKAQIIKVPIQWLED